MAETGFIEFSRPFIDAAKNCFETMAFCTLEAGKPSLKTTDASQGDISAIIGLSGEIERDGKTQLYRAMLVLSFPYDTYFKIASAMLSEEYTTYHPDIHDLGGEFVNMIMGNAKRDLKALGYSTNMAIPSTIEGSGHRLRYPAGTTVVLIPFETTKGKLFMELGYSVV